MNVKIMLPEYDTIEQINESLDTCEGIEKIVCFSEEFKFNDVPHKVMFETVPEDEYAQFVLYEVIPSTISGYDSELLEVDYSEPEFEDVSVEVIFLDDNDNELVVTLINPSV